MNKRLRFLGTLVIATVLFASCQNPSGVPTDDLTSDNTQNTSTGNNENGNNQDTPPEGDYLDFKTVTTYEMNIGDSIQLYSAGSVSYEVMEGTDIVSIDSTNVLTSSAAGEAKVCLYLNDDTIWYCWITVKASPNADEGNGTESNEISLIGRWEDGDSYLQLNANGTGYMLVYLNSNIVQDVTFDWSDFTNSYGHFLTLTNTNDYLEGKQFTITVTATTLKVKGYLGFGMPQNTSWSRAI